MALWVSEEVFTTCGQPQRSSRLFAPLYSDTAIYGMTFGDVSVGAAGNPEAVCSLMPLLKIELAVVYATTF